jgi:hypothetical protein
MTAAPDSEAHDRWSAFVERYREQPLVPYLCSPAWLQSTLPLVLDAEWAIVAGDESGDRSGATLVVAAPDSDWIHSVAQTPMQPTRLIVTLPESAENAEQLSHARFVRTGIWTGMVAPVPDRPPRGEPARSLATSPELLEAFVDAVNPEFRLPQGLQPLTSGQVRSLTEHHPLWNPANIFVVVEDGAVVATARLNVEHRPNGDPFGFVRWLSLAPARRTTSGIRLLAQLYTAIVKRLQDLDTSTWYLKVIPDNTRLYDLYRKLGFVPEGSVSQYTRLPISL